jgi:hypothetical protein
MGPKKIRAREVAIMVVPILFIGCWVIIYVQVYTI